MGLSLDIAGNPGCGGSIQRILPATTPLTLMPLERERVLLRMRHERHTPDQATYPLEIALTIHHAAHGIRDDPFRADDFRTRAKSLLIE